MMPTTFICGGGDGWCCCRRPGRGGWNNPPGRAPRRLHGRPLQDHREAVAADARLPRRRGHRRELASPTDDHLLLELSWSEGFVDPRITAAHGPEHGTAEASSGPTRRGR